MSNWYAVFVPTGQEDIIKKKLEHNLGPEFRILVAKRELRERKSGKWKQVTRTLFPGYVLINGVINVTEYRAIKNTTGIIKILENEGEPLIILPVEIDIISRLTDNGDVIGASDIIIEGENVRIIDGPLKSLEGVVEGVNKRKGRIKVRLNFLGQKRSVELAMNVVEKTE